MTGNKIREKMERKEIINQEKGKGGVGEETRGKRWKGERHNYHSTDGIPACRVGWKNNTYAHHTHTATVSQVSQVAPIGCQ